ncbi:transcriptional regulatory protein pho23 [Lasius niger]|uniref:Transcriptional regulatory protein pho23 n=1 Tax=Lasius niger TaxID=67767 RepID=A0A0J7KST8_LASNI|nr:transcriptional regulatory protein pho23 [Lasius niger]
MEDEDGESKIIDMWNILEEQRLKDSTLGNALKHSIQDDVYTDVIEEEKQLIRYNSVIAKDTPGKNTVANPKLTFKGFKKRILAQAREIHTSNPKNITPETQQLAHPNARGGKDKRIEVKRERKITEYAQYLGLQPSTRYKCSKCHMWSICDPNTKQNSCTCNPSMTPMPSTSESSTSMSHSASNFKITRKVYLCAACGTYFENWNLFLHMRDIHKRHICLYCLGMFGQAERLSYHLMKKHSVPEMAFTSVEDFYNAFKGSCYLVCCSCERVFSETDDFFNHYCSLTLKQDVIDTPVCTICRQSTGMHASTCSLALSSDTDKELYSSTTPLSDATHVDNASPAAILPPEKTTNLGGKGPPKKAIKHNKSKHSGGDGAQNSRQQKPIASTRKIGAKTQCNESRLDHNPDIQREVTNNLPRDTVTETIMEVSRYTGGDSSDENDENDEQAMNKDVYNNRDRESGETSPAQNYQFDRNEPYDSVTETIMEVSRYTGEKDNKNEREEDSTYVTNECTSHTVEKMNTEDNEVCDKSDIDLVRSINSRPSSPVQCEAEETAMADAKAKAMSEPEAEVEFRAYDSPQDVQSPVGRSLFSPQHESHALDPQSKEKEDAEDVEDVEDVEKNEEEKEAPFVSAAESQASASFNAVVTSDRSLIIKICNRNSQFSVATATAVSKKSEKNNNAQGSTSKEKMLNGSKMERDINGGHEANNELDDSDSDSDKLAVVDSNPEEDEEAEDGEEAEEADEVEEIEDNDKCNDTRDDESQENREGNGGIGTGTSTDRETFAATSMPSHNVNVEEFVNNETEDTVKDAVASDQTRRDRAIDGGIALAGEDAPCIDLNVEGTLDSMELEELLKRCIEAASPICVYCNHARHIAVNGKQLGLHMLAEHKFQPQHPAIIIQMEQFTTRVRRSLDELESRYFNLNTYTSANGTYNVPAVLIYECFHCRFHSAIHKELYLHNRKMHQKTILICIMCKSTFYSYSELLCHLCPGVYSSNMDLRFRCCLCSVASLPSAFRLMVHLRKRHHVCDVCLESTGNQQRLSNHVWKHKLHHLCYRCGIAYRNKPDITKHLFWKHGTESVLCRKCLQKKWPHIYHFCIPPTAFVCEECGLSFGRAVALKVHKRLHSGDSPYGCDECTERFISRKLLAKHQAAHREPKVEDIDVNTMDMIHAPATERDEKSDTAASTIDGIAVVTGVTGVEATSKNVKEAVKRVVDVYDLPPLNLSSESDTDSEEEKVASAEKLLEKEKVAEDVAEKKDETAEELSAVVADDVATLNNDIVEVERNEEEKKQEARIMDGIWDNFKTYAASLDVEESAKNVALKESVPETDAAYLRSIIFADHDYFVVYSSDKEKSEDQAISKDDDVMDEHDGVKSKRSPSPGTPNRNAGCDSDVNKRKAKTPKKKKRSGSTSSTSDSSSDTDSSSCSCGTNCSCSSSSSGSSSSSSSSSDSDSSTSESSPRKQSSNRKEKHSKKEREVARENKSQSVEPENKPEITVENGLVVPELTSELPTITAKPLLRESDLETEETETDEDFYDEQPQLLANKLLSEKRNQLLILAAVAPVSTPISALTPAAMEQPSTPLNNGILDAEKAPLPEPIVMTIEDHHQPQQQQQKRKTKTKKRRKGERGGKRNTTTAVTTVESIKLNIPKAFYRKNPGFVASSPAMLHPNSRSLTPNQLPAATCNDHHGSVGGAMEMMQQQQTSSITAVIGVPNQHIGAGSTETENKRVSKRKRVPKRFYGDSSDDEPQDKQPAFSRWRKIETTASPRQDHYTDIWQQVPGSSDGADD